MKRRSTLLFALQVLLLCHSKFGECSHYHPEGFDDDYHAAKKSEYSSLPKDGELFEEDIVMDSRLRRVVLGIEEKRSYLTGPFHKLWPNGRVPFKIDEDSILPLVKKRVKQAIREFERYTCVKWVPANEDDQDYVVFRSKPHTCSSNVGRIGGQQFITLGQGCTRMGTVVHEMMHVLDFVHEQTRPDRDQFVKIVFDNINSKYLHNFQKYDFNEAHNDGIPYNYNSVMHYSNSAFSKNGEDTIVARVDPTLRFGQRRQFSCTDIREINRLYGCPERTKDRYCEGELMEDVTADDVLVRREKHFL